MAFGVKDPDGGVFRRSAHHHLGLVAEAGLAARGRREPLYGRVAEKSLAVQLLAGQLLVVGPAHVGAGAAAGGIEVGTLFWLNLGFCRLARPPVRPRPLPPGKADPVQVPWPVQDGGPLPPLPVPVREGYSTSPYREAKRRHQRPQRARTGARHTAGLPRPLGAQWGCGRRCVVVTER